MKSPKLIIYDDKAELHSNFRVMEVVNKGPMLDSIKTIWEDTWCCRSGAKSVIYRNRLQVEDRRENPPEEGEKRKG